MAFLCIDASSKELGTHLGAVTKKGRQGMEDIPDGFVYTSFLQNLQQMLQNQAIRAQVANFVFVFNSLHAVNHLTGYYVIVAQRHTPVYWILLYRYHVRSPRYGD